MYKTIAALAVAVLAAAGCTSIEHGRGSSVPPGSVQTARSTSRQPAPDLRAQLLTVADLPSVWSIDNSSSDGNADRPPCLQRLDSEVPTHEKAVASFVKGSSGFLDEGIAYFGDNATASGEFSTFAATYNGCTDMSFTSDGTKVTGSIGPMSFPNFGDQSQAWALTLTAEGTTLGVDLVLMQKGAELAELFYGDFGWLDVTELQTLAKSAADKMP